MSKLMWCGSDTLYASRLVGGRKFPTKKSKFIYFLGYTIFAKIADLFVECHYVVAEHLKDNLAPLKLKKEIKVLIDPPQDFPKLKKKKHKGFNVLYYRAVGGNTPFREWVYGFDILNEVLDVLVEDGYCTSHITGEVLNIPDTINIVEVNGKSDMKEILPYIDCYIRPNRGDGAPRMVMECEQLGIPYYWSKENPIVDDIVDFIKKEYAKK